MEEWLKAKGDPEREKVVYNTRFGESYEQVGAFEMVIYFLNVVKTMKLSFQMEF